MKLFRWTVHPKLPGRLSALALLCGLAFGSAAAQCVAGDPTGTYKGSAISGQAGPLELTLNLRCDKGSYAGALDTAVGRYTVISGSFQADTLKLVMTYSGNRIAIELKRTGDAFEGSFSSADDSGPVKLHRTGDVTAADPVKP